MEEVAELLTGTLKEKEAADPNHFEPTPKRPEGGFAKLEKKKTVRKR